MRFLSLPSAALFFLTGCAFLPHKTTTPTAGADAGRYLVGAVAAVNQEAGFVLVNVAGRPTPRVGLELETGREGETTGQLRVTGEVRRPYVVADMVGGEVRTGDNVWARPADPVPVTTPAPAEVEAEPDGNAAGDRVKKSIAPVASGDSGA